MAQANWTELLYRQLKRDSRPARPDWWQRTATVASILSSVVIAGVGLLLTWSFQNAQLAITQAQFEATKAKNEDDRKGQAAKLASDLFPQLFSESPHKRKVAIKLLSKVWSPSELNEILDELATNDDSSDVRKTTIALLDPSNSVAARTLAQIGGDPSRPTDERDLALSRLSDVARITTRITGASRSASFYWDGERVPLVHSGDRYEAQFQSSAGKHIYALQLFGDPGDAWNATVTDGKSTQNHGGHMSPGGMDVTGDSIFYTSAIAAYVDTGSQFLRQAWCRDLLALVNKTLAVPASIPGDAECSTAVSLVEAALEKSPPADQKVRSRDNLVLRQLKAVMSDLSLFAQARVCAALKGQAEVYSFCSGSGRGLRRRSIWRPEEDLSGLIPKTRQGALSSLATSGIWAFARDTAPEARSSAVNPDHDIRVDGCTASHGGRCSVWIAPPLFSYNVSGGLPCSVFAHAGPATIAAVGFAVGHSEECR